MGYGYRIMMTEMCEIPGFVPAEPGCTEGFSDAPYLVEDIVYHSIEEAEEAFASYISYKTGIITDRYYNRIYGAREFYIEKIKTGQYERKISSYGAVKYAPFGECCSCIIPAPPPVVRWCRRKNSEIREECCITYKRRT